MTDLLWIDVETTGTNPMADDLLEIAVVITDEDLVEKAERSWVVSPGHPLRLEQMDAVVIDMHGANGLLSEVVHGSSYAATVVDRELASLLEAPQWEPDEGGWTLCGSSVHFDREFVRRSLPHTFALLHYRLIDVSTIKRLVRMWMGEDHEMLKPIPAHRALPDVRDSIAELRYYRSLFPARK